MRVLLAIIILAFTLASAVAQNNAAPTRIETTPAATDPSASVPLRDYLTAEIVKLQQLMDERDRQYAQRFDAQQEALSAALLAQKEAVANALSAAKEAVTKAEDASNKRFDSVNEFRNQLNDQAQTFMSKDTAEARFSAVEEKTANNTNRLDAMQASSAGSASTWAFIGAGVLLIIAIATFAMRFRSS